MACAALSAASSYFSVISIVMVKMECERDESWFMAVAPTERFFLPTCAWEGAEGARVSTGVRASIRSESTQEGAIAASMHLRTSAYQQCAR